MIPESTLGLVLGLTSMCLGFLTFVTRAALKSNCIKLSCLCCACERETTHNVNELEINPLGDHNK